MFVQIIEGRTQDAEGIKRLSERWQTELRPGAKGYLGVTAGTTADGKTIAIVRFESKQAAEANAQRPEQTAWWSEMEKYYEGSPTFTESSDVEEVMGGGQDTAGFVQVMKSSGVDRKLVQRMDGLFEKYHELRPDILGSFRVWTGKDSCVEAIYFTSEKDARAGEKKDMPAELQQSMAEFEPVMQNTEFLDLTDPQLH